MAFTPVFKSVPKDLVEWARWLRAARNANGSVTNAELRDSSALSVVGRASNSAGSPADITASANEQVLYRRSNSVGFDYIHPRTAAEIAAGVTPTDYAQPTFQSLGSVMLSRYLGWDPTGATSSRTAFNNALELIYEQGVNHTEASQIGGRIIIPHGIVLLDSTVTIGYDNIEIVGGHGATIRTNGSFAALTVEAASLSKIYGVTISGLRFTSTVTNQASGSGAINVIDAEMIRILNCRFHLLTEYGVRWENVINGYLQHCDFDSADWNDPGMTYGLLGVANNTSGNNGSHISFCAFRRARTAGVRLIGQELRDPPDITRRECAGNTVYACDFEHNYGDGLQIARNRALDVRGNWFEANGKDGATGHGHIMDIATDDDEAFTDPATSGLGGANCFASNVFGGHGDANADFQLIGLRFQTNPIIEKNYFNNDGGIIGLTADCRGLVMRDNWGGKTVPTLAGALPTIRTFSNNKLGPADTFTTARPWGGSFYDYDYLNSPRIASDGDTTPSLVDSTFGRIYVLMLSNTGATSVTFLDDGYEGQVVRLIATNGNTTLVNGTNNAINLAGAANYTMTARDSITLMLVSTGGFTNRWIEIGRSEN